MNKKGGNTINIFINIIVCIIGIGSILFIAFIFIQVFCFSSFKIPSDSMEPSLEAGDNIVVCNL